MISFCFNMSFYVSSAIRRFSFVEIYVKKNDQVLFWIFRDHVKYDIYRFINLQNLLKNVYKKYWQQENILKHDRIWEV